MAVETVESTALMYLEEIILANGGYVNAHSHLDRAYTVDPRDPNQLALAAQATVREKWSLVRDIKLAASMDQIYSRMARGLEGMVRQGVSAVGSFIDVDQYVQDKALRAALKARETFRGDLQIVYMNQTLEGVLDPNAREWFEMGAQFADIVGGLPSKDEGREKEHMDVVLQTAKGLGKRVHMHADQEDSPLEKETKWALAKVLEHNMQGRVTLIHAISVAAHPKNYRDKIYQDAREAQVDFIACPNAWANRRRNEMIAPIHNSVTPIDEMAPAGLVVAVGTDNIEDLYCPYTSGSMRSEMYTLLNSARFYDIDELVKVATVNGRRVLGLQDKPPVNGKVNLAVRGLSLPVS